jgi:ElaB/YqjD/DUF883 family membrane-anchored ribosome-binding protein
MATNGGGMSDDMAGGLGEQAGRFGAQVDALRNYCGSADEVIRDFARERPLMAVAIAVGIGFLLGRLAART